MWDWLEKLLQLISLYGFPLVAAGIFLVAVPLSLRSLWSEYRRLNRRHHELIAETSRLMELASYESELASQTIDVTLKRLSDIRLKIDELIEASKSIQQDSNSN